MRPTEEEIEQIRTNIIQQNEEINASELAEKLDELSQSYQSEAESILRDLNGSAGQRSLGLRADIKALSEDIRKIYDDIANGSAEDFRRDAHDLDQVINDLERLVLYGLTAFNLAKKSNTIAKYNAKNGQKLPKNRIESNNAVMDNLQAQMAEFHDGVKNLTENLEEINQASNNRLSQELGKVAKLIHYIEYFAETGTPDPEIRSRLEKIEEKYDRKASKNLEDARDSARSEIDKLIRSQERRI